MSKAILNHIVIADSDRIVLVEGNTYFPKTDVDWDFLQKSHDTMPTYCHWKGMASYFDVVAGGVTKQGAAWWYPSPHDEAAAILDHVAFWNGVEIVDAPDGRGLVEQRPSVIKDKTGWKAFCWQLKFAEDTTLSQQQMAERTGIPAAEIGAAWSVHDVRRYAKMYKWRLGENFGRDPSSWIERVA